ncbi:TIR domain-containing protein [Spiroplasma sp. SV19]|uniref:TIR domain-containing protein n=1 Tax=Spiroplasma sp. SV19 TaxID=2570468 RepID=UPI0024B6B0FF|nr:TIR domain-containing protein [Spiroplasma sp. SV19]WHQ36673.1 hypothetical protein E7Y35_01985 [Spiroplasma sp. SV19]
MQKDKILLVSHPNDEEQRKTFLTKYQATFDFICPTLPEINNGLFTDEMLIKHIETTIISDTKAAIILIGSETWKQKIVDWVIAGILNQQKGLFGIILSTNNNFGFSKKLTDPNTIPLRLMTNVKNKYAELYNWNIINMDLTQWVNNAYHNAQTHKHNNQAALFRQNQ